MCLVRPCVRTWGVVTTLLLTYTATILQVSTGQKVSSKPQTYFGIINGPFLFLFLQMLMNVSSGWTTVILMPTVPTLKMASIVHVKSGILEMEPTAKVCFDICNMCSCTY